MGHTAGIWNFAALGYHQNKMGVVHSLIVSTPDPELAQSLRKIKPSNIQKTRGYSQEHINFSAATIKQEADCIPPNEGILSVLLLSPIVVQDRNADSKRWHTDFNQFALADAVNHRLSRLAKRPIHLMVQADPLYLRANPKHSVYINLKHYANGQRDFVLGMQAPLILAGSEADLRFAWYAGIGEKNRNGFGCIGLLEIGVGR
jgi:CRISPR-associated endoribonuclease Cas6